MLFKTRGEKAFDVFNVCFMGLMVLVFLYPFLDTVSLSLARPETANRLGMRFLPDFPVSFDAYREVATNRYVFIAFGNTLFRTIIGSTLSTFTTFCGAFVLAKRGLPFKKAITSVILFTMFFSGGLIPSYLLMRSLHLVGSRWALILPGLTSAWNLFIARNFMITIPQSMEEAAIMDGAGVYTTMFRIILPLSMPIIAVLFLWSGVGHWNAYFDAMIYTPSNDKLVLQLLLRRILIDNTAEALIGNVLMASAQETTPETVKAATIIVAIAPILCVYPFLQKYFVKGINIGAIKG